MAPRLDLQALLKVVLGSDYVYFQAPPTTGMNYPCIVYKLDDIRSEHADNVPFITNNMYQVTVIDRNPDSDIWKDVSLLPSCSFDRSYAKDGLNHYVFNLFY